MPATSQNPAVIGNIAERGTAAHCASTSAATPVPMPITRPTGHHNPQRRGRPNTPAARARRNTTREIPRVWPARHGRHRPGAPTTSESANPTPTQTTPQPRDLRWNKTTGGTHGRHRPVVRLAQCGGRAALRQRGRGGRGRPKLLSAVPATQTGSHPRHCAATISCLPRARPSLEITAPRNVRILRRSPRRLP